MSEKILVQHLLHNLQMGELQKITKTKKKATYYREIGTSSYLADIFITLQNQSSSQDERFFDSRKTSYIAIEVKIKDWKSGLYQAWRYKKFAEKSFLAIHEKYIDEVNIQEFINHNIGLIAFNESMTKVVLRPKKDTSFKKESYEDDLRSKIWDSLARTNNVQPAF